MIPGVLVLDKPEGPTSHDMVAVARRALGERRIGHCGTLDPMATGVLALAVGPATRLVQYLSASEKDYRAVVRFGVSTTTYDITGAPISTSAVRPSRAALEAALAGFRGPQQQVPPSYSAKKIDGHRAYDLARRAGDGEMPAMKPVTVTVYDLTLVAFDEDEATLDLRVSPGFYVRSLAHDLGQALGMGAALAALRRTRAGDFDLTAAVTVETLTTADRATLAARMVPLARLLPAVPTLTVTAETAGRVRQGVDLPVPDGWLEAPPLTRLLDGAGELVALAVPAPRAGFLHPSVVLG
jgi:tRNA pseudouridine55 synthase